MRIRVERQLREEFLNVCKAQDRPAAQILREFMREYVALHSAQSSIRPEPAADETPEPIGD